MLLTSDERILLTVSQYKSLKGVDFPIKMEGSRISNPENLFVGGDKRINQDPLLLLFQTLFMRNHNRLAASWKLLYPEWDDETLFYRARFVNQMQYKQLQRVKKKEGERKRERKREREKERKRKR